MSARRSERLLLGVAAVAGVLMARGAFALLPATENDELTMFWVRLLAGIALATTTVWAIVSERWLATAFLALVCCITPVAENWSWVALLYIVIAVWALAKVFTGILRGPRAEN